MAWAFLLAPLNSALLQLALWHLCNTATQQLLHQCRKHIRLCQQSFDSISLCVYFIVTIQSVLLLLLEHHVQVLYNIQSVAFSLLKIVLEGNK